jgi:hypothetical protein
MGYGTRDMKTIYSPKDLNAWKEAELIISESIGYLSKENLKSLE